MNEPADHSLDDATIEQMLCCLKQLEPTVESRVANRVAVAAELDYLARIQARQAVPIWRRPVPVPWPLAAAALAMLVMLSVLAWPRASAVEPDAERPIVNNSPPIVGEPTPVDEVPDRAVAATAGDSEVAYRTRTTYFCGLGPIDSEIEFLFPE